MKAIRVYEFGDENVLKLEDVDQPKPKHDEILISVKAIGVNPVETYIRTGAFPVKPELPYTPGSDAGGIVEEVGESVVRFSVGDRVYTTATTTGAYAEKMICHADDVHPLSSRLTFEQGAAIGIPYATAYHALFHKARVRPGNTILIHGASGGVGLAAVQLANSAGLAVIASVGTEAGDVLVREIGAHQVVNHHDDARFGEIAKITGGHGVDYILEMLSDQNLAKDLEILAHSGKVIVIGCRGTAEINPRLLMSKDATISGMTIFNANSQEVHSTHAALFAGFEKGFLKPFIGKEIPLADAGKAHYNIIHESAYGKIILKP